MKRLFYLSLTIMLASGCNQVADINTTHVPITGIDSSINPGDDFFMYVNSIWYDSAQIPPGQTGVGSYSFLNYPQRIRLQGILDSLAASTNQPGSIEQKVGDFYASGMDTLTIDKRGYEPIKPLLAAIEAVTDVPSLLKLVAEEQRFDNGSIIGFWVGPDNKQSTVNIAQFFQAGIALPEKDYYTKLDRETVDVQNAYKTFLDRLFELTGSDTATALQQANVVYGIQKQLATSHRTNIELRDINANYNKVAVSSLVKKHPNLNWEKLLAELGVKADSVNIGQPAYYDKLNAMLKSVSITDWKTYLKATTLSTYADLLSKPFAEASFQYTKAVTGQAVRKSRAEEMTQAVDQSLGHALAQIYVKKYFPDEAKKRIGVLVTNLKKALEERITKLDWMSDSTKTKAKEKLAAFTEKIGYPDKWRDYKGVNVKKDAWFENVLSANKND